MTALAALAATGGTYYLVIRARGARFAYAAPLAALVVACLVCYLAVVLDYDPNAMTEIWCDGGQPAWWPSWLPL